MWIILRRCWGGNNTLFTVTGPVLDSLRPYRDFWSSSHSDLSLLISWWVLLVLIETEFVGVETGGGRIPGGGGGRGFFKAGVPADSAERGSRLPGGGGGGGKRGGMDGIVVIFSSSFCSTLVPGISGAPDGSLGRL